MTDIAIAERALGTSGLTTPPLVLGGNVFGWTVDREEGFTILDAFIGGGGRMIDTADVYSMWVPGNQGGESEAAIGAWLARRGRRDDLLIATKVGMEIGGEKGLSADRIADCAEASLRRLGTDYIDLYYAHADDESTPLEETLKAFDKLVKAGKVRAIGASNYSAARLNEALDISEANGWTSYSVLQPEYNLLERDSFEGDLQNVCVSRNVAALPYYALASGFLTGKYRSDEDLAGKARGGSVEKYLNDRGKNLLSVMDEIAAETGSSLTQIALAWLASQPGVAAPIASATSPSQVEELLGAMRLELSESQLSRLKAAG